MGFDFGAGGSVLFEIFNFEGILGCGLYESGTVWIVVVLCFSVEIDDGVDFLWMEDNSMGLLGCGHWM